MLRRMVQLLAQRTMEIDVQWCHDAGYDDKNAAGVNSRNGYLNTPRAT